MFLLVCVAKENPRTYHPIVNAGLYGAEISFNLIFFLINSLVLLSV